MILETITLIHVLISLVGILSGFAVLIGLLSDRRAPRWTRVFLVTTVLTSVTGFFFPVKHFMPSHAVGILSLLILAVAIYALRSRKLAGAWRKVYVITAMLALYLNVFVLLVQLFEKVPQLKALAPTQSEPPFKFTQLAVLMLFVVFIICAAIRFKNGSARVT